MCIPKTRNASNQNRTTMKGDLPQVCCCPFLFNHSHSPTCLNTTAAFHFHSTLLQQHCTPVSIKQALTGDTSHSQQCPFHSLFKPNDTDMWVQQNTGSATQVGALISIFLPPLFYPPASFLTVIASPGLWTCPELNKAQFVRVLCKDKPTHR